MTNWNLWRTLNMEYIINPCSGIKIKITRGQKIEIVDIEEGQVVDFFCRNER